MNNRDGLHPAAIGAGIAVVAGIFYFASQKKKACTELPDIWAEDGPLHLTIEAQEEARRLTRYKLREYMLSMGEHTLSDLHMYVADELRDCSWENLETEKMKQVFDGIGHIVSSVNEEAKADREAFLKSFG